MKTIKVLGTGCATCKRLLTDVNALVAKNGWQAQVEYITDLPASMAYNLLSTPALVVDERVIMVGHPGAAKVEAALFKALAA